MDLNIQYEMLVESLKLLTLPFEEQKKCFPDFVVAEDEVVSIFGDTFLLLPQLIENDFLSRKAIASIIRCFNLMELAIRNSRDGEAAVNSEGWRKVREMAIYSIHEIGEKLDKPDLSYIRWMD